MKVFSKPTGIVNKVNRVGYALQRITGRPLSAQRGLDVSKGCPRKIVVSFPTGVGDAIMAMPMVRALRNNFPRAEITLFTGEKCQHLLDYYSEELRFSRLVIDNRLPRVARLPFLFALAAKMNLDEYDLAVNIGGSMMGWVLYAAGIKNRAALDIAMGDRPSLAHHSLALSGRRRRVHETLQLLREIGVRVNEDADVYFNVPEGERRSAEAALVRADFATGRKIGLYIKPGPFIPQRTWPNKQAIEFIEVSTRKGFQVIMFGRREDVPFQGLSAAAASNVFVANGSMSLGMVGALMQECETFVGVDGGLTHLAAALRVPLVYLSGPVAASVYGPPRSIATVLGDRMTCDRAPCFHGLEITWRKQCRFGTELVTSCTQIPAARVMQAVEERVAV